MGQFDRFMRLAAARRLPRRRLYRLGGAAVALANSAGSAGAAADAAARPALSGRRRPSAVRHRPAVRAARLSPGRPAGDRARNWPMPLGPLGSRDAERARPCRHRARPCAAHATSPFDIGQAVVVADNHVLAVEGPEGTDRMLARVAELRAQRPHPLADGNGRAGQGRQDRPGPAHRSADASDRRPSRRRRPRALPASPWWQARPSSPSPSASPQRPTAPRCSSIGVDADGAREQRRSASLRRLGDADRPNAAASSRSFSSPRKNPATGSAAR